jgi:hypothetical protein
MTTTEIIVSSIPHTGTHTTEHLLDKLNIPHKRYHIIELETNNPWKYGDAKALIPMRDPGNAWMSFYQRNYWVEGDTLWKLESRWKHLNLFMERHDFKLLYIDRPSTITHEYWLELTTFMELNSARVLRHNEKHIKKWLRVKRNAHVYSAPIVPLPTWVEDTRRQWGYTNPFNIIGYIE